MPTWKQYKHHHNNNNNTIVNKRNAPRNRIESNRTVALCSISRTSHKVSQAWIRIELNLFCSFQMKEREERGSRRGREERRHDPLRLRPHNSTLWLPPGQVAAILALGFSLVFRILETAAWATCVSPIICFCTFLQLLMSFKGGDTVECACVPSDSPSIHPSIDRSHWSLDPKLLVSSTSFCRSTESFKGINNDTSSPSKCLLLSYAITTTTTTSTTELLL